MAYQISYRTNGGLTRYVCTCEVGNGLAHRTGEPDGTPFWVTPDVAHAVARAHERSHK